MSTQINVTVGSGGLSDRAKQQQQAARQAQLEKERTLNLSAEALDKRVAAQAAKGLSLDGKPLYGTSFKQPQIERRPAANRRAGDEFFLMRPSAEPVASQVQLNNRGLISFATVVSGTPTYSSVLGPNSSPTLICASSPRGNYVNITGRFPFEDSNSRFKNGVQDFTLQYYAKFGTNYVVLQDYVDTSVRVGSNGYIDINLGLETRGSGVNRAAYRTLTFTVRGDSSKPSIFLYDLLDLLSSTTGPQLLPGVWHHVAISRSGTTIRAFFDGEIIGSTVVDWPTLAFNPSPASTWLDAYFGTNQVVTTPAEPVYLHGLRFDTKALYTANFTPPLNL
jgi:hypothetical protein